MLLLRKSMPVSHINILILPHTHILQTHLASPSFNILRKPQPSSSSLLQLPTSTYCLPHLHTSFLQPNIASSSLIQPPPVSSSLYQFIQSYPGTSIFIQPPPSSTYFASLIHNYPSSPSLN